MLVSRFLGRAEYHLIEILRWNAFGDVYANTGRAVTVTEPLSVWILKSRLESLLCGLVAQDECALMGVTRGVFSSQLKISRVWTLVNAPCDDGWENIWAQTDVWHVIYLKRTLLIPSILYKVHKVIRKVNYIANTHTSTSTWFGELSVRV